MTIDDDFPITSELRDEDVSGAFEVVARFRTVSDARLAFEPFVQAYPRKLVWLRDRIRVVERGEERR